MENNIWSWSAWPGKYLGHTTWPQMTTDYRSSAPLRLEVSYQAKHVFCRIQSNPRTSIAPVRQFTRSKHCKRAHILAFYCMNTIWKIEDQTDICILHTTAYIQMHNAVALIYYLPDTSSISYNLKRKTKVAMSNCIIISPSTWTTWHCATSLRQSRIYNSGCVAAVWRVLKNKLGIMRKFRFSCDMLKSSALTIKGFQSSEARFNDCALLPVDLIVHIIANVCYISLCLLI